MNTECVLNNIKAVLDAELDAEIDAIEIEASATAFVDDLAQSEVGDFLPTELTSFPAYTVQCQRTSVVDEQYEFQVRRVHWEVVGWIVQIDNSNLHRFICRMGDAITRLLRNETKWQNLINTPLVNDATYSSVYNITHGLAQGCQILGSADYILSNS
jgi:hypothetical protein